MIIDRRKTHFFSFVILACILPLIFFIGVIFSPEYPLLSNQDIPGLISVPVLNIDAESTANLISTQTLSSGDIQLQAQRFKADNSDILQLTLLTDIHIPEPLIYWQKGEQNPSEITQESILLGQLSSNGAYSFYLTPEMINNPGQLILYSPILQEIKGVFAIAFNQ